MDFLAQLEARAAAVGGRVVLAEGHDERIIEAAAEPISFSLANEYVAAHRFASLTPAGAIWDWIERADDLIAAGMKISLGGSVVTNRDGTKGAAPERPILARGRVRHVGEPIAMIVADTLAEARDATLAVNVTRRSVGLGAVETLLGHITALMTSNQRLQEDLDCSRYRMEEQAQQIDDARREARTDQLTTVSNRKAFDEKLHVLKRRWEREGKP